MGRALILASCLTACASVSSADIEALSREEVSRAFAQFRQSIAEANWDEAASFYADHSSFSWVEDGEERYRSANEVKQSLKRLEDSRASVTVSYDEPKIVMLDRNLARLFSIYTMSIGDPNDGGFSRSGAFTSLMAKVDGEWRFLMGHSSTARPRR